MPRILALVVVFLLTTPYVARGQGCCAGKPAKRARSKSKEAKAKAMLEKAKAILGAGKGEQAIKRLRRIVWKYPKTKAAVEALLILGFTRGNRSWPSCYPVCRLGLVHGRLAGSRPSDG
jgi:outer membrane protein assembly factor BamD (BamD/ComL family)